MTKRHKHKMVWYVKFARQERAEKVIVCAICRKTLDDILEELYQQKEKEQS